MFVSYFLQECANRGGGLISILNKEQSDLLSQLLPDGEFWIGLTFWQWQWQDGEQYDYHSCFFLLLGMAARFSYW